MIKKESATLKQIAANLKLSISTISRALNDNKKISESTKAKVKQEALRLNYVPNILAKSFRNKKSKIIGVVVPSITQNFTATILRSILIESEQIGYRVIISETNNNPKREKKILNEMLQFGVDGILVSLSKFTVDLSPILQILYKKPLILFDKVSSKIPCTQIVIDEIAAAFKAVEHLINIGKKNIAIIKELENSYNSEKRYEGYLKALKQYNIEINENLIINTKDVSIIGGEKAGKELVNCNERLDAVFCIADCLAVGVIKVLKENDIKIPERVAVVGFSNSVNSVVIEPNLTTVNQPGGCIGKLAVQQMIEEIESSNSFLISKSIEIGAKLVIRESTLGLVV